MITKTLIYNAVVLSVYILCVTVAAVHFNNTRLLFWYFFGVFFILTYKKTEEGEKDG